jgi:hypothetical protein
MSPADRNSSDLKTACTTKCAAAAGAPTPIDSIMKPIWLIEE